MTRGGLHELATEVPLRFAGPYLLEQLGTWLPDWRDRRDCLRHVSALQSEARAALSEGRQLWPNAESERIARRLAPSGEPWGWDVERCPACLIFRVAGADCPRCGPIANLGDLLDRLENPNAHDVRPFDDIEWTDEE